MGAVLDRNGLRPSRYYITEDDQRRGEADVQKLTDKYVAKIDELYKKKEAEVMAI